MFVRSCAELVHARASLYEPRFFLSVVTVVYSLFHPVSLQTNSIQRESSVLGGSQKVQGRFCRKCQCKKYAKLSIFKQHLTHRYMKPFLFYDLP